MTCSAVGCHRDDLELTVLAIPAERSRFPPCLANQVNGFLGHPACLIRGGVVGFVFVRCAAQKQNDDTSIAEAVEHGDFLSHSHRIQQGEEGAEQRNFCAL
jgi:hypothetical protein